MEFGAGGLPQQPLVPDTFRAAAGSPAKPPSVWCSVMRMLLTGRNATLNSDPQGPVRPHPLAVLTTVESTAAR